MTVLRRGAGDELARRTIRPATYLGVGLLSLVFGAGAVWAALQIVESPAAVTPNPVQIAQTRADAYVNYLGAQWLARVHTARAEAMVQFYTDAHRAHLSAVQSQRAKDMAQHFAGMYNLSPMEIAELRAQDMVDHMAGVYSGAESPLSVQRIQELRAQDMVDFHRGGNSWAPISE